MNLLKSIYRLFFPKTCAVCKGIMPEHNDVVCTKCQLDIPTTGFWREKHNPVYRQLSKYVPLNAACSYFYYIPESGVASMIHDFKYSSKWLTARRLGRWFGAELRASALYNNTEVIIPVPLHGRKLLKRGYNQSCYIAEGIAKEIGAKVDNYSLIRRKNTKSQTKQSKTQRWDNVSGVFDVIDPHALTGKNIMLVDDVLTTGATLVSCAQAILKQVPECTITICTIAVSSKELS